MPGKRGGIVTTPAGWYPDPQVPGSLRCWDGLQWTEHRSSPGTQQGAPKQHVPKRQDDGFSLFGNKKRSEQLQVENDQLRQQVAELQLEVERLREKLTRMGLGDALTVEAESRKVSEQLAGLRSEEAALDEQIRRASGLVVELQDNAEFQDVGLYKYLVAMPSDIKHSEAPTRSNH